MSLPLFVTGEPKKQWNFIWQLLPPALNKIGEVFDKKITPTVGKAIVKLAEFFLMIAPSLYVSQLAKKVDLPDMVAETEKRKISSVEFPFITAFPLETIRVEYLEDTLNTVYLYHKKWQDMARLGMNFLPILKCCQQGVYVPTAMMPTFIGGVTGNLSGNSPVGEAIGGAIGSVNSELNSGKIDNLALASEIPVGIETFPQIFPIRISRTSPDKNSSILSTTTITYLRVPKINKDPGAELRGLVEILGF